MEKRDFVIIMKKDVSLEGLLLKKDSEVIVSNHKGTIYWDVISEDGEPTQVTGGELREVFIRYRSSVMKNKGEGEDFFLYLKHCKFRMLPNQQLSNVFKAMHTKEERKSFNQNSIDVLQDFVDVNEKPIEEQYLKDVPIEGQSLYISWPQARWGTEEEEAAWGKDLGALKDTYAVTLTDAAIEATGILLSDHTFYLNVVELDDRYRFFIHYDQIIGQRWLFENFKGEAWDQ